MTNRRIGGFRPPSDVKQWWLAPHCGPGSLDTDSECGFCGENVIDCALRMTQKVKEHPEWNHDGSIMGEDDDDPETEMACGGSGFWCHNCGRFWAQNSCGECSGLDWHTADGADLVEQDGNVYCVCGQRLMSLREDYD